MPRKRFDLAFPPNQATKPITYHLVKDFDLTPNILRAQIQPGQEGRMLLEITGPKESFDAGIAFLEAEGITVSPAATDIRLDEDVCVLCGLCTAVCRPGALVMDAAGDLIFDKDKCVYCEACVIACPRRAVTLSF
ncbi:MAG: NIL domain-containing protein [Actinomycetota bacterium]|nr:MAG: NIL domain-containing [Actinomycetota bacterium]MDO8949245.1 NIL domain-containing protein [Actinomycetota bacterium]MDP3629646.1 NIL domain-containing protein [Actinomycetota bacterium]